MVASPTRPTVEKSDQALIWDCLAGNKSAFGPLYRRHQAKVRSTLYQLCGPARLEDLTQEVFLRLWQGLSRLRNPDHFSTWLYRIAWNVAQDERRRLGRSPQLIPPEAEAETAAPGQEELLNLHYQDLAARALQSLSLEHRVVLILHDLEDLPQKTVAEILRLPQGTVKSRLFYARKAVRQYLQTQGVTHVF